MELGRLRRQRAVDEVYHVLREGIMNGLFKPGERLNIPELARSLGVSLTPVRHALQMLTSESLVDNRPRVGTFVATPSIKDVEESFEVRCALECLAAEKAVGHLTEKQRKRLRALMRVLAKPVQNKVALRRHESANAEFHHTLLEAAGNRLLTELYDRMHTNLLITVLHNRNCLPRHSQEKAEHEAIMAALEARNIPKLLEALRNHILRAKNSLVSDLKKMQAPDTTEAEITAITTGHAYLVEVK